MNKSVFSNKNFILLTMLTLLFLILFVKLGFWQISRSYEKQSLSLSTEQTKINGFFDYENTFEIPDQIYNHKIGSTIITPFKTVDNKVILVNRGFIEKYNYEKNKSDKEITLYGHYRQPKAKFILGKNLLKTKEDNSHYKIQYVDNSLISNLLNKSLYNQVFLLEKTSMSDNSYSNIIFERNWDYINMSPEKHLAYAFQWFTMAFALAFMYLYALRKFK